MGEPAILSVLTESGWFPIRDVMAGDKVLAITGEYRKVSVAEATGAVMTYRVTMADGGTMYATLDHMWWVQMRAGGEQGLTTEGIHEAINAGQDVYIPTLTPPRFCPIDPTFPVLMTRGQRVKALRSMLTASAIPERTGLHHFRTDNWQVAASAYNATFSMGGVFTVSPGTTHPLVAPAAVREQPPSQLTDLLALETAMSFQREDRVATYEGHISLPTTFPLVRKIERVGSGFEHTTVRLVLDNGRPYVTKDWVVAGAAS